MPRIDPLKLWAFEIKSKMIPPVSAEDLFMKMLQNDNRDVWDFYTGRSVPRNPIDRSRIENRIEALKFVATQVVAN